MNKQKSPGIKIIGGGASGNRGDGFRSEGVEALHIENFQAHNNGGKGINIVNNGHQGIIKTIIKWSLSVAAIVVASLIVAYVFGIGR